MNLQNDALLVSSRTTAAAATVAAVIAGFTELNTGHDQNPALMAWLFFVLAAGFVIQLARLLRFTELMMLAAQPAAAFVAVQLAGSYFYGITEFSSMHWDWSFASAAKLATLFAVTVLMIAVVAQAGPLLAIALQWIFNLSSKRAKQIVTSLGAVGSVLSALVILYELVVLRQGSPLPH
jgi:hypothetical protein